MKQDEQFIETVEINNQLISKREGTFADLIKLEAKTKKQSVLKGSLAPSKADEVIKVSKFVWNIIKDSKAEVVTVSSCTRILSGKDDNWENYGGADDFASDEVTYKLNNFIGTNCYTIKFKVAGTCSARNPEFGGEWIPNAHVTFIECEATFPWVVNGTANIDTTNVSNMGTVEEPIPQVVLTIKISTKAKVALNWESHEKTFEFILNAKSGAKKV